MDDANLGHEDEIPESLSWRYFSRTINMYVNKLENAVNDFDPFLAIFDCNFL